MLGIYIFKVRQYLTTICKRQEDHGDMETDINETENAGMKDETRGNRDKWRGVRDVTEIRQT